MANISAAGIGSGLDVTTIISQLMTLERRPLVALQQKEAGFHAELSSLGQLRSAVSSYQSAVSALTSPSSNTITLAFEDSVASPIADPLGMTQIQAADDASFIIDGTYTITRSSNTVTDAIQGVTLNLLEVSTSAAQLDVVQDTGSVTTAVNGFVNAYNTLQNTLAGLSSGELSGDSTLRMLQGRIRSILNSTPTGLSGTYSSLSEIGVEFQKDGTLTLDSADLSSALKDDRTAVIDLFANDDQGYAFRLNALMDDTLDSDGLISARESGINASISTIKDGIERMETRLEIVESRLRAQFSALDLLVSNMQTTGNFLTQQLDRLSNMLPNNRN